jgi:hypothetical protein
MISLEHVRLLGRLETAFLRHQEQTFYAIARELAAITPAEQSDSASLVAAEAAQWQTLLTGRKAERDKRLARRSHQERVADAYDEMAQWEARHGNLED